VWIVINRFFHSAIWLLGLFLAPGLEEVVAEADRVVSEDGVVSLNGNTTITFQNRVLTAEDAQYNPDNGEVSIEGALNFEAEGLRLESNNAVIDIDDNLFSTDDSTYEFDVNGKRATGNATSMERNELGHFTLDGATYSSCPPGDKSWYIRYTTANRMALPQPTGTVAS